MERKIEVGILGATGMVGQQFIEFLQGHPWFEVKWLGAERPLRRKEISRSDELAPGRSDAGFGDAIESGRLQARKCTANDFFVHGCVGGNGD